jgi:AcrR family transcriptional regulator
MSISERKQRDKIEMENLILNSAMELFLKEGYDNVTIRKIAEKIEYSPTTIYLYFKDKDEIFFTLQKMAFREFNKVQLKTSEIKDPIERFFAHGKSYINFATENPGYYDLMFIMNEPVRNLKSPDEWKDGMTSYDYLKQNIKDLIQMKYLPETDIEVAAFSIWSLVHGIASLVIRRGIFFPEEYRNQLVEGALMYLFSNLSNKS